MKLSSTALALSFALVAASAFGQAREIKIAHICGKTGPFERDTRESRQSSLSATARAARAGKKHNEVKGVRIKRRQRRSRLFLTHGHRPGGRRTRSASRLPASTSITSRRGR